MSFTIKVNGLAETIKYLNNLNISGIPQTVKKSFREASGLVLRTMKSNTPVDTGYLKAHEDITIVSDSRVLIGPDSTLEPHYAPDVEYGHHTVSGSWVPGQHFIENTLVTTRNAVLNLFISNFRNLLHG